MTRKLLLLHLQSLVLQSLVLLSLLLLTAPLAVAGDDANAQKAIDLQSVPIYLPMPPFWTHALSHATITSGNPDLDEAYTRYLDGDMLSARAHLYKARFALRGPNDDALRLRLASLACLIDIGEIDDTFLILKSGHKTQTDQPSDDTLLVNRWKPQGGSIDPQVAPWVELFTAYQQYQRGDLGQALAAWQRILKNDQYPTDARGLGGLGVIEVAGEVITDAKKSGQTPQITREEATKIALLTKLTFDNARLFAVGQCILLEAQIQYIDGDPAAAFSSLEGANKNFEGDRSGWVDVNLIGAIGEGRKGNTENAEGALRDVEDEIPDLRVPPEQVQALAAFAKRLPAITGMDEDNRPVDQKLTDAREFFRWANGTDDPLLRLIALRTLASTLREGGYWTDASFFDALEEEAGKRYRAAVPFVKRVRAAALLDYDFLVQTKFFETHDLYPVSLTKVVNGYIAGRKGMLPAALEYLPGMTLEQANARFEEQVAPLREVGRQGDAAQENFRAAMKSGDSKAILQAVIDSANAQLHLVSLLNILGETTHRSTTTETENNTVFHEHKQYKIHAEVTSEYRITDRKLNKLELDQLKSCLDNAIQVVLGGIEQKENIATNGAAHLIAFYEKNRDWLAPPESYDIPLMLSGESSPFACALPDNSDSRRKSLDEAENVLKARYRQKLIPKAVASVGFDVTELNKSQSSESASDLQAAAFFEKNFVKDDSESHEDTPVVTTGKEGELPLVTIKQSYKVSYDLADNSEYKVAPQAATGIGIEPRAEAARLAWARYTSGATLAPRLDKLLTSLYRRGFSEGMIGQFMGSTPEQLAGRNSVFSSILNAAQMAFSVQRSGDFLMLPGRADFHTAQDTLQKNEFMRRFLTAMAQPDPDSADYEAQIQEITEQFPGMMDAADTQLQQDDADIRNNPAIRAVADVTNLVSTAAYRPFLFLLLDDRASADKAAAKVRNTPGDKTIDKITGLVLYDIGTGDYADAVAQLNGLPADARARDPLKSYQLDYVVGICYRRLGNQSSEAGALNTSISELNRFRRTLVTRNEAAAFQPLRQMLYEELLGTLFAGKQYAQMADAIKTYKRSSQIPVSVLQQSKERDPRMTAMLDDATFAFDTLSRDEVWKAEDLSGLLSPEFSSGDKSKAVNPRDAVLAALNHMTDVLIDQFRVEETNSAQPAAPGNSPGALTISYFVGNNGLYRVDEQSPADISARFVPVSSSDLSGLTTHFRSAIEERRDPADAGTQLYETLLGDLPDLSAVKSLHIEPDGVLNLVPFQALKSAPGAPYLIQQHTITYITGALSEPGTSSQGSRVLLIGNPDTTLPAAEDEVNAIAGIKDFQSDAPLMNTATLARVREQLPPASLVHFATHARANQAYPNFAFLQLAQGERMYSYDLGGMTFAGKQVFLSACETRTGSILPGDDVYGIADAFLAGGASSVVATLWRIESDSSALFAQRYYQILAETHDPSDAVAQTAREFIEGKQKMNREGSAVTLDAPIYWAPFTHLVPQAALLTR